MGLCLPHGPAARLKHIGFWLLFIYGRENTGKLAHINAVLALKPGDSDAQNALTIWVLQEKGIFCVR